MPTQRPQRRAITEGPPLRVPPTDDHQVVRQDLISRLSEEEAVQLVSEAADWAGRLFTPTW